MSDVATAPKRTRSTAVFLVAGLAVALALAFFASPYASSSPDGLEKVAADQGIDAGVSEHALADGAFADYAVGGVDDEGLGTGLAGILGVAVTGAAGTVLFAVVRIAWRRREPTGGVI